MTGILISINTICGSYSLNIFTEMCIRDRAKVEIYGVQPPTIDVILTPSVMARSGITPSDISRAFEAQNLSLIHIYWWNNKST